jgi:hypothetical protein
MKIRPWSWLPRGLMIPNPLTRQPTLRSTHRVPSGARRGAPEAHTCAMDAQAPDATGVRGQGGCTQLFPCLPAARAGGVGLAHSDTQPRARRAQQHP